MISALVDRLSLRLVPDELWAPAEPLIPVFEPPAGLWRLLHHALVDELGRQDLIDWSRASNHWWWRSGRPDPAAVHVGASRPTMVWLTGYRRLTLRYERKAEHFLAFPILGASLTCYKKLRNSPHEKRTR
jgi:hypothetical protein